MGGGASRRKKKPQEDELGLAALTPSLSRRRRVLFGSAAPQPFEQVSLQDQFTEDPQSAVKPIDTAAGSDSQLQAPAEDVVFRRLGLDAANDFRNEALSIVNADFLLGAHSIAKCGLGIDPPRTEREKSGARLIGSLEKRLFQVGQVGGVKMPAVAPTKDASKEVSPPRLGALTCYELLALYSVIRAGTQDELLELLFCVFDVDGDDKISVEDFEATISSFLEVEGLLTGMEGTDLAAYLQVQSKDKSSASRRTAELAVSKYGAGIDLEPPKAEPVVEAPPEPVKEKPAQPKKAAAKKKGGCCLCKGKPPKEDTDDEKDGDKKEDTDAKKKNKEKDEKGKTEDSDSEGSGYSSDGKKNKKPQEKKAEAKKGAKKGGFWSPRHGKQPDQKGDGSKDKDAHESDDDGIKASQDTHGDQKKDNKSGKDNSGPPTPKKAPKAAAKKKSGGGCCLCSGGKGKQNSKPTYLSFNQWKNWFVDNFGDFLSEEPHPAPSRSQTLLPHQQSMAMPMARAGAGIGGLEAGDDDDFRIRDQMRQPLLS